MRPPLSPRRRSPRSGAGPAALAAAVLLALASPAARADVFNLSGSFTADDQVLGWLFTLNQDGNVVLSTDSYGTRDTANGGFDAALTLFRAADGARLTFDAYDVDAAYDPAGGDNTADLDDVIDVAAALGAPLPAGQYIVTLSQGPNLAEGQSLSDGFLISNAFADGVLSGDPATFTGQFSASGQPGPFVDATDSRRTGAYSLTIDTGSVTGASSAPQPVPISPVRSAAVPEPGAAPLLLLAAGAALAVRRRRPCA